MNRAREMPTAPLRPDQESTTDSLKDIADPIQFNRGKEIKKSMALIAYSKVSICRNGNDMGFGTPADRTHEADQLACFQIFGFSQS